MSKLYDFWSPHIDEAEMTFYRQAIKDAKGKVLELACAGGRLLLPFLSEGYDVEGVDASPAMIEVLRKKAAKAKLTPTLYCQKLEDLEIKKKYRLIYISLGSIQLIKDPEDVKLLFRKCYQMLEEGGQLIVAFFLPWAELPIGSPGWKVVGDVRDRKRNVRHIRRENSVQDPVEQTIFSQIRFEIWQGRYLLEMEEKEIFMRWYVKGECHMMFKDAGFEVIEMQRSYKKNAPPRSSFMLFKATK